MSRLGDTLRAQRERKGITLDQAAADTRIREKFLKALEDSDYRALPGTVYTKGFLRNYADYLELNSDELVVLLQQERDGTPEPTRTFQPMRPVMSRSLIFTPAVLLPVIVLAGVVLFLGYLYVQFTTFAVAPPLEMTQPASETAIVQDVSYTLQGKTLPSARVNVQVNTTQQTYDVRALSDGTFSVTITLTRGAPNHVTVQVFDQSGKVTPKYLTITVATAAPSPTQAPAVTLEQPTDGGTYTNIVPVSGTYDASVVSLTINGVTLTANSAHRFDLRFTLAAGPQQIRAQTKTASGATTEVVRTVIVRFDAAVVNVAITSDAWLQAVVDGTVVPGTGRVFKAGEVAQYIGREVVLRSGNGAGTVVSYNGEAAATLGQTGGIVEKTFRAP